jgi:PilZ domain
MKPERRRSDRVMLTIPLVISGVDNYGRRFEAEGRTVSLNRHGLLVHATRPLRLGQVVVLSNLLGHREAEFRAVGPVAPLVEGAGEWALESVDPDSNIWGIGFPPLPESESEDARGLLECRGCHAVVLMRVSGMETEVLTTSGLLSKRCATCGKETPWGYAEKQIAMDAPREEIKMISETSESARRRHRRVSLQLPILIRDFYGGAEITQSENVSKGGLCFASDVVYHVGQGVQVICPYDPSGAEIEVSARIVRNMNFTGRHRRLYGVRYEAKIE